ncbi:MAG: ABC transporter permease [Anaerolineae bacterium]|nr:ABC transporter permease [Anaerolineae bacterium]
MTDKDTANTTDDVLDGISTLSKADEKIYYASQWQLIVWKFGRHKLALISLILLTMMYIIAFTPGFFAPYLKEERFKGYQMAKPSRVHIFDDGKLQPFIYDVELKMDQETFRMYYEENPEGDKYPIRFFVRGSEKYPLFIFFQSDMHLFGVDEGGPPIMLFGSDGLGRDLFSRIVYGATISMTIGLVGVTISFLLGVILGGLAGYVGGLFDAVVLVIIDLLQTIPQTPLWMTLSAAVPRDIPVAQRYFMMTLVLSLLSWTGLARVVRGRLLAMREEDFALAAKGAGASTFRIVTKHLIPGFTSHLIVSVTLAIPSMILGEVALGFLGLGMQKPAVSWGVLLQDAQNIVAVAHQPWLIIPAAAVILVILLFNFVGDGLRDSADPYVR